MFECQLYDGWKDGGAKAVIEEAPKKQKRDGWNKTRNALAVTIRYNAVLFLRNILESVLNKYCTGPGSFAVFLQLQLKSSSSLLNITLELSRC